MQSSIDKIKITSQLPIHLELVFGAYFCKLQTCSQFLPVLRLEETSGDPRTGLVCTGRSVERRLFFKESLADLSMFIKFSSQE